MSAVTSPNPPASAPEAPRARPPLGREGTPATGNAPAQRRGVRRAVRAILVCLIAIATISEVNVATDPTLASAQAAVTAIDRAHGSKPEMIAASDRIAQALVASEDEPIERLVAGCQAYVRFGLTHPARYGVLFSEERIPDSLHCTPVPIGPDGRPILQFGAESFALLVDALEGVERGVSVSSDVVTSATAVWVAMHGTVSLGIALPEFPWPSEAPFVRQLVLALSGIDDNATSSR